METMRWILLGVGAVFLLVIYLSGRKKTKQHFDTTNLESEDLPDFSANQLENSDEDVSNIRISAREINDVYLDKAVDESRISNDEFDDSGFSDLSKEESNNLQENSSANEPEVDENDKDNLSDIIVLNVIAREAEGLHGDRINSALIANKLKFGSMSIYHRMGLNAKPLFSAANMIEPGSFVPETMHDMRTPGITFFMQLPVFGNNSDALSDMLQCAYKISEMLDADLCDQRRKPLSEIQAEKYRELAKQYDSE